MELLCNYDVVVLQNVKSHLLQRIGYVSKYIINVSLFLRWLLCGYGYGVWILFIS